jgi:hypothetical protein
MSAGVQGRLRGAQGGTVGNILMSPTFTHRLSKVAKE